MGLISNNNLSGLKNKLKTSVVLGNHSNNSIKLSNQVYDDIDYTNINQQDFSNKNNSSESKVKNFFLSLPYNLTATSSVLNATNSLIDKMFFSMDSEGKVYDKKVVELKDIMMNGATSDEEALEFLCDAYQKSIENQDENAISLFNTLAKLKENNPNISYLVTDEPGSFQCEDSVYLDRTVLDNKQFSVLFHETGHLFHYAILNDKVYHYDETFVDMIENAKNNNSELEQNLINNLFFSSNDIQVQSNDDFWNYKNVDNYEVYYEQVLTEMKSYIDNNENFQNYASFVSENLYEDVSIQDLTEQYIWDEVNEYADTNLRANGISAIEDIMDALSYGKAFDEGLYTTDDYHLNVYGHGSDYYTIDGSPYEYIILAELIAN